MYLGGFNIKVIVFGSKGMVGSSVFRKLKSSSKITDLLGSSREDTDLFDYCYSLEKKLSLTISQTLLLMLLQKLGGLMLIILIGLIL